MSRQDHKEWEAEQGRVGDLHARLRDAARYGSVQRDVAALLEEAAAALSLHNGRANKLEWANVRWEREARAQIELRSQLEIRAKEAERERDAATERVIEEVRIIDSLRAEVERLREALRSIAEAQRRNRVHFANDTDFADWAQSRARHVLREGGPACATCGKPATPHRYRHPFVPAMSERDALAELRRKLEEATPGPWRTSGHDPSVYGRRDPTRKGGAGLVAKATERFMDREERLANAALIAAAVSALPHLLDVAEAAREWRTRSDDSAEERLHAALTQLEGEME